MLKSMSFVLTLFLGVQTLHANPLLLTKEEVFTKGSIRYVIDYATAIVKQKTLNDHEKIERLYAFHQWLMSHHPLYIGSNLNDEISSADVFVYLILWEAIGHQTGDGFWFLIESQLSESFRVDVNDMVGEDFRQSLYPKNVYWLAQQEIKKSIYTPLRSTLRSYGLKMELKKLFARNPYSRELKMYYAYFLIQYIGFTILKEDDNFYRDQMQSMIRDYQIDDFNYPSMKAKLKKHLEISSKVNSTFDKLQATQVRVLLNLISGT